MVSSCPAIFLASPQVGMISDKVEKRVASSIFITLTPPRRDCGPAEAPPFLPAERQVPGKAGWGAGSAPGEGEAPLACWPRALTVFLAQELGQKQDPLASQGLWWGLGLYVASAPKFWFRNPQPDAQLKASPLGHPFLFPT